MTHSIKSLGKAFPLDSLQRAAVSPVGSVGASKCLRPFEVATGDPHLCTLAPGKLSSRTAHPAFSVGHFDPLISLRSESGCHLGNLIFNDIEALRKNNVVNLTTLFSGNWRVCYVAIRKLKTCSGSFGSRAGTLSKYVILNCWSRLPQKSSRVNKKF